jgi:hypothetical protein
MSTPPNLTPDEFYDYMMVDPNNLLFILKKHLQLGEDLTTIGEEFTSDKNAFIIIFISHPEFEELFYNKVEELATAEIPRIVKRSTVLALRELTTSITIRRGELDAKDVVAAARALTSYEISTRPSSTSRCLK